MHIARSQKPKRRQSSDLIRSESQKTRMLLRKLPRALPLSARFYSTKPKNKVSRFIDDIGREETKTSQNTLKVVRYMGGVTIVTVLCSLFWASSMSAPVKETEIDLGNLAEDVRRSK